MERNRISWMLFGAIILVVTIGTAIKVFSNHRSHLLEVSTKRIEEAALKCVLENVCTENKTTLGFLIQNGYLDEQIHPVTKEYISESLEIECKDYVCTTEVE